MDDAAEMQQRVLWQLSDEGGQFRDPMQAFRDLCRVQREALSGESEGDFDAWQPF